MYILSIVIRQTVSWFAARRRGRPRKSERALTKSSAIIADDKSVPEESTMNTRYLNHLLNMLETPCTYCPHNQKVAHKINYVAMLKYLLNLACSVIFSHNIGVLFSPSVLWHCCSSDRKGIWLVKISHQQISNDTSLMDIQRTQSNV